MPIIVINPGDASKFDDLANKREMLLRYHSPTCGHCIAMESEWKALEHEQSLKERNIAIVDIDVGIAYNINHPSAKTALSQGVPSIYFIKKNQMFEYSGERKAKKIAEFAILHLEPPKHENVIEEDIAPIELPEPPTLSMAVELVSKRKRTRRRRRTSTNKRRRIRRRRRYSTRKYVRKLN